MKKRTYQEIARDYKLWQEYADPSGVDSEGKFNAMTEAQKIEMLIDMFGPEEFWDGKE